MQIKKCKECAEYKRKVCKWGIGSRKRKEILEDYEYDCFHTQEDVEMCKLFCGEMEDE